MIKNISNVENIYPTNENDIYTYIAHLIQLTNSDGYIDDNEIAYMKAIVNSMNVDETIIDETINKMYNDEIPF